MDIGGILYELDGIEKEIVRLRKKLSGLNSRKKELTTKVIDIMKENGDETTKYNGKTYTLEQKPRHTRKPIKQKMTDVISILEEQGIERHEAEDIYHHITDAMKGPEKVVYTLKK